MNKVGEIIIKGWEHGCTESSKTSIFSFWSEKFKLVDFVACHCFNISVIMGHEPSLS